MHLDIHEDGLCKQSIQQEVAQKHLNFSNDFEYKQSKVHSINLPSEVCQGVETIPVHL